MQVECRDCIIGCTLPEGGVGSCRTRRNNKGVIVNLAEGRLSSFSTDFVEKVPLYHFHPNNRLLTVGGFGCNLHCRFCLTWNITQEDPLVQSYESLSPERLVAAAIALGCRGLAYTHSEPTLNMDYYEKVMKEAHDRGLVNVLATNGFASLEVYQRAADLVDAVALTIKGGPEFYRRRCGVGFDKEHFQRLIDIFLSCSIHLELVYVLIPGENDDDESLNMLFEFALRAGSPIIFLRFFPSYKMDQGESTSESLLEEAVNKAYANGVRYAYMENIFEHPGKNTYCPKCRTELIRREGYGIVRWKIKDGRCLHCGEALHVVGEAKL